MTVSQSPGAIMWWHGAAGIPSRSRSDASNWTTALLSIASQDSPEAQEFKEGCLAGNGAGTGIYKAIRRLQYCLTRLFSCSLDARSASVSLTQLLKRICDLDQSVLLTTIKDLICGAARFSQHTFANVQDHSVSGGGVLIKPMAHTGHMRRPQTCAQL